MEGAADTRATRATPSKAREAIAASGLGTRLRALRTRAGLTQAQLAGDRYTGSYVSALENGLVRASMAALTYLAGRLEVSVEELLSDRAPGWHRLEADLHLASGDWTAALDRYTALLESATTRLDTALLQRGRAEAYCRLGRPTEAVRDATPAWETLKDLDRHADAAYAAYWLANAHHQLNNPAEARAIAHQVLAEVRAGLAVQTDFKVRLLVALAAIESWDGQHERALALLEEARAMDQEMDDRARAALLFSLAIGHAETGDHEAAVRAGTQALALYQAVDAPRETTSLRNSLALAYLQAGNLDRADELAHEARRLATDADDRRLLSHVADTQAQIALARTDEAAVRRHATEALELARESADAQTQASALLTLARMHRAASRPDEADAAYRSAIDLLRPAGPVRLLQSALQELAELLTSRDRHPEAIELLREALGVRH